MPTTFELSRRDLLELSGAALVATTGGVMGATPAMADSQAFSKTREAARKAAHAQLVENDAPAASFALFDRNGLIWADAVGVIDKQAKTPATTDTLFCIGSCSKVIAAAATMVLVDRGKVELDAPLTRYLPNFRMLSDGYADITVRMLMSHASGFPGTDYRGGFAAKWNPRYPAQVMETLRAARLKHRPGEMSVYCNDGFTMLEPLIKQVSGKDFPAFVESEIFAPLGMRRSRFGNRAIAPGSFAPGYAKQRKQPLEAINPSASGGAYTTPSEMARFLAMFLNEGKFNGRQVLSAGAVKRMGENQSAREPLRPAPSENGFGLGWDSVRADAFAPFGLTAWRKNGGTATYATDMIVIPQAGLGVIVTGSSIKFNAGRLAEQVLLTALVEQGALPAMPQPLTSLAQPVAAAATADPRWFDGVFAHHASLIRFEKEEAGTVSLAKYASGKWTTALKDLKPREDGALAAEESPTTVFALTEAQGATYLLQKGVTGLKHYAATMVGAQKLPPLGELSPAWRRRMGKTWLIVNEPAESLLFVAQQPIVALSEAPGAQGYVVMASGAPDDRQDQAVDASKGDRRALMCLKIPFNNGRDLNDLEVFERDGQEWLRIGSTALRPLDGVAGLGAGAHVCAIGPEGYAEWRRLDMIGALSVSGCANWKLFNDEYQQLAGGAGDVRHVAAPQAAYLWVDGKPGARISVALA